MPSSLGSRWGQSPAKWPEPRARGARRNWNGNGNGNWNGGTTGIWVKMPRAFAPPHSLPGSGFFLAISTAFRVLPTDSDSSSVDLRRAPGTTSGNLGTCRSLRSARPCRPVADPTPPPASRLPLLESRFSNPASRFPNPASRFSNPASRIPPPASRIPPPAFPSQSQFASTARSPFPPLPSQSSTTRGPCKMSRPSRSQV
jgi:hypothetical protein